MTLQELKELVAEIDNITHDCLDEFTPLYVYDSYSDLFSLNLSNPQVVLYEGRYVLALNEEV